MANHAAGSLVSKSDRWALLCHGTVGGVPQLLSSHGRIIWFESQPVAYEWAEWFAAQYYVQVEPVRYDPSPKDMFIYEWYGPTAYRHSLGDGPNDPHDSPRELLVKAIRAGA